jgi:hypothetical protein
MNEIQYYDHAEASAEAEYVSNLERERDEMLAELLDALALLLPYAARAIQGTTEGQPLLDAARAAIAKAEPKKVPSIHDFDPPF